MRQYHDSCGLARALNLVGERWALLVVRELLLGPKRFSDLRDGLPGISPNVLSQRLAELSARGVVEQQRIGPPTNADVYRLTAVGQELEPALIALAHWGSRAQPPSGADLSPDGLLLAMRTTADVTRGCPKGVYQLLLADDAVAVHVTEDGLEMARRLSAQPIATVITDAAVLTSVIFGGRGLHEAAQAGDATVTGSYDAAEKFLGIFESPQLIRDT